MTAKLASISASLEAKVMVNSCPSMAWSFLLLVVRQCSWFLWNTVYQVPETEQARSMLQISPYRSMVAEYGPGKMRIGYQWA
jgi:hypothetical protein